jgi:hypothetical protein
MIVRVRLDGMTVQRMEESILEVRRNRKAMATTYPAWVRDGKLAARVSEGRQAALCDAEVALCAMAAGLSAPPEQAELPVASAAIGATAVGPTAATGATAATKAPAVGPTAATGIGRKLPYDRDQTIETEEPPPQGHCRFCNARLERAVQHQTGAASYRCSLPACPGHLSWASLDVISKTTQEGATK